MWRVVMALWLSGLAWAGQPVLRIGTAESIEPYAFKDSGHGIELDIIRDALALRNITVQFQFYPLARLQRAFDNGEVDAITPVSSGLKIANTFLSQSHIQYQNVVVTLRARQLTINHIMDLAVHDVVAFQRAKDYLGYTFAQMANDNPRYHEQARQDLQVNWFMQQKTDAIVLDIRIFQYWLNRLPKEVLPQPVDIHYLFAPNLYSVGFRHSSLRDQFNLGLKQLQDGGGIDKIVKRYIVNER